ncbi:MAG: hypothetical protein JNL43_04080 [Flavobacteriales bacterium]|nr:hypothetical protein [Flavobacteriales bacterium]
MNPPGRSVSTDTADITLVAPRFIEQRFRSDGHYGTAAIERNRLGRKKVSGGIPCVVMIVIPADLPVDPSSANVDHFRTESNERCIIALAVVTQTAAQSAVTKFYFRYYAQAFEVRVFDGEEEAREWLNEALATGAYE